MRFRRKNFYFWASRDPPPTGPRGRGGGNLAAKIAKGAVPPLPPLLPQYGFLFKNAKCDSFQLQQVALVYFLQGAIGCDVSKNWIRFWRKVIEHLVCNVVQSPHFNWESNLQKLNNTAAESLLELEREKWLRNMLYCCLFHVQ